MFQCTESVLGRESAFDNVVAWAFGTIDEDRFFWFILDTVTLFVDKNV